MNKEDRVKVLKDSIEHWRRMRALSPEDFDVEDCEAPYGNDCPCCGPFGCDECRDSSGDLCPIATKAGYTGCSNTPWRAAADAFDEVRDGTLASVNRAMERWHTAADDMIAFMEECLKEEEAK